MGGANPAKTMKDETPHLPIEDEPDPRIAALRAHLELEPEEYDDIEEGYSNTVFEVGQAEYLVLTDDEADALFDEMLDQYIDDCVLTEMPDNLHFYFDDEKFKRDVRISDGRGHTIASYDGAENEEVADGEYYFIYRVN